MIIDYASSAPIPQFRPQNRDHLANYSRVYSASQARHAEHESAEEELKAYFDMYRTNNVDHVVVHARDVESTFGLKISNEAVAEFCAQNGPRFIGFAGVDPHKGEEAARELEHAVKELGLRGLNIQCFENRVYVNDPLLYPLFKKCVELEIPVNLHCGVNFSLQSLMEYGRPLLLDRVMVDFPSLKVIASPPGWPWVQELIAVAWRHRNVHIGVVAVRPKYLDVANSGYEPLLQYGRTLLQDQMIFGSAFPLQTFEQAFDEIRALPIEDSVRAKWLGENAARLLRLE